MAATTIVDDLVQELDRNPEARQALTVRLLPRDLLELPRQFAAFAAGVNRRLDRIEERLDRIEERLDRVEERLDRVEERLDRVEERLDRVEERLDRVEERLDGHDRRFDRMATELGPIKAAHARNSALEVMDEIAEASGLAFVRTLTGREVRTLARSADTAGIAANELRSFGHADAIVEARDGAGDPCYLAVEVSYTVNGRDTTRAARNAAFLRRFTGRRSIAAVVGLRRDDRVREAIEQGEVGWYELDAHALEAE